MSASSRSSSQSIASFSRDAEVFLGEHATSIESIDDILLQMPGPVEHLPEPLRERVEELAHLMTATRDESQELASFKHDATFELSTSDEEMFLCLSVKPAVAGGKAVTTEDILAWLKDRDVRRGVDLRAIRGAVEEAAEGKDVSDVIIARGQRPEAGRAGTLECFGRPRLNAEPGPMQLDSVLGVSDRSVWLCKAGDLIARRLPSRPGTPGYDVWGKQLPPPRPPDVQLELGEHVRQSGNEFFAETDGAVSFEAGILSVKKLLVLVEDVTPRAGAIDFDGEIHVHGAVRDGAVLRATNDVIIDGVVEGATVGSKDGGVTLKQGIAGRHRGLVQAKNDVHTRFAENATIQAGDDIHITVGAIRCNLAAGQDIILDRGRGQLMGGVAIAGRSIEAKQIGTAAGVATEIILGLKPDAMMKLAEIDAQRALMASTKQNAAELAERIQRIVGEPMKLERSQLELYKQLRRVQLAADLKLLQLEDKRHTLLAEASRSHDGRVRATRTILPNVRISIGSATIKIKEQLRACSLVYDETRTAIVPVA